MQKISHRSMIWGGLLLVLLLANLIIHWPAKSQAKTGGGWPPGMTGAPGEPPAEMKAQINAAIQKLPEDQRAAVTKRMEEDRAFFDSVKSLPEQERQQKVQEHFAQNPPPQIPGMPGPPPRIVAGTGGSGPGAPGQAGRSGEDWVQNGHIPPPEARYRMDQRIANPQKGDSTP